MDFSVSDGHEIQAATATNLYAPSVCTTDSICAKGKWYLPALGELVMMYNNLNSIDSALNRVEGTILNHDSYCTVWSSTERYTTNAWYFDFCEGAAFSKDKNYSLYVRPVLAF